MGGLEAVGRSKRSKEGDNLECQHWQLPMDSSSCSPDPPSCGSVPYCSRSSTWLRSVVCSSVAIGVRGVCAPVVLCLKDIVEPCVDKVRPGVGGCGVVAPE